MDGGDGVWSSPLSRSNTLESLESLGSATSTTSTSSSRAKTYFCDYDGCDKAFTRPSLLTTHQQSVHNGIKPFECNQCERTFVKKSHLERHLYTHSENKPYHCRYCHKGVTTSQQLKRHEITHTKSFKCTFENCAESFYKHPQLRAHILAVHLQKLKCSMCGKDFQRPYRLRNHVAKHHNPQIATPYQCTFLNCTLSFKTWSQLQSHTKKDHPKLKCAICGKPCVGEKGLQMHMVVHDENLVTKNWKCALCPELVQFHKKLELQEHYMAVHNGFPPNWLDDNDAVHAAYEPLKDISKSTEVSSQKRPKISEFKSIANELAVERYLQKGENNTGSSKKLLLNAAGRKFKCTYYKCYRTFKTEARYQTHLEKHKIYELKLKIASDKQEETAIDT